MFEAPRKLALIFALTLLPSLHRVAGSLLKNLFNNVSYGPALLKWGHYFDIYEKHFARFRGTDVHVLEIGVYAGGSLKMWRSYFGKDAKLFGIDIKHEARYYQGEHDFGMPEKILIGDQSNPVFWERVKRLVPRVDILVDDGSHEPAHQLATVREMMPHIRPGGLYFSSDFNMMARRHPYHCRCL